MTDWKKLKVAELKEECKARDIPLAGIKLKQQYIDKLEEYESNSARESDPSVPADAPDDTVRDKDPEGAEPSNGHAPAEAVKDAEPALVQGIEESGKDGAGADAPGNNAHEVERSHSPAGEEPAQNEPDEDGQAEVHMAATTSSPATPGHDSAQSPPIDLADDQRKRKRRSATPAPTAEEVALKRARIENDNPVSERTDAAANAHGEAEVSPKPLDVSEPADNRSAVVNADTEASSPQPAPADSSKTDTAKDESEARTRPDREPSPIPDVAPSIHPPTSSLYIRNFKRPLHIPTLKEHVANLAQSGSEPGHSKIKTFYLDGIRSHAFISFTSPSAASRVRAAMHRTRFPDEPLREPLFVDYIPDDIVQDWIEQETGSGFGRGGNNKRFEVVYSKGPNGVEVSLQDDESSTRKRAAIPPPRNAPSNAPRAPAAAGVHPDRAGFLTREDRKLPFPERPKKAESGETGFKELDELFSFTKAKPKLYYKPVAPEVVDDRLDMIKGLHAGHADMGRSGDEGMKRYTFETIRGRQEWVDKGPEFGHGQRGLAILRGERGQSVSEERENAQAEHISRQQIVKEKEENVASEPENPFAKLVSDQQVFTVPSFTLESGVTLKQVPVAYTTRGKLSDQGDNALVVCHALSGSADVADWWGPLLGGPGQAFDVSRFFVVCLNSLGSPYGSASPVTFKDGNPELGRYGPEFPLTTIRDDVRIHKIVLDSLGVKQIAAAVGGSMGGMLVLEYAYFGKDYVRTICPIATSARHSAWGISWGEAQRQAIYSDPKYEDGYYSFDDPPASGLGAARMSALLTYRSRDSFEARFGRNAPDLSKKASVHQDAATPNQNEHWQIHNHGHLRAKGSRPPSRSGEQQEAVTFQDPQFSGTQEFPVVVLSRKTNRPTTHYFSAQSYLRYQGNKFISRFDANCYIAITRKLDTHDVARGRAPTVKEALGQIEQPTLVLGIESDGLFTIAEQEEIAENIPNGKLGKIESPEGHDAFLLQFEQVNKYLLAFFREHLPDIMSRPGLSGSGDGQVQDGVAKLTKSIRINSPMAPKVFITGVTGYIGGDVLYALVEKHPDWEITALVRNEDKGSKVTAAFPKVKLVYGTNESAGDAIEAEVAKADIVYHFAGSADDVPGTTAIIKGLQRKKSNNNSEGTPAFYIHTSGTGILAHETTATGRFGDDFPHVYNDGDEGIGELTSLPDYALHRNVDKLVLAAGSDTVKTAIVSPPTIYGPGRGPDNKRSIQVYRATEAILKNKRAFVVGKGENVWHQVHVQDLSDLYVALGEAAASGSPDGSPATWNEQGYYLAENGTFVWGRILREVANEAHKQGYLPDPKADGHSPAEVDKFFARGAYLVGTTSRGEAIRARKLLGWKPHRPSLQDLIPDIVASEAKALGLTPDKAT
ncbi:hypothetical protein DV738_g3724, partial [Chaetothyriales sp. CBS 135597]